jgi:hypothetical protein
MCKADVPDGTPAPRSGAWPILEADRGPLRTAGDGRLVVHQLEEWTQFSGWQRRVFGLVVASSSTKPDHVLEFRHAGHRPVRLDFDALDQRARVRGGPRVERIDCIPLADVHVDVVMEAE